MTSLHAYHDDHNELLSIWQGSHWYHFGMLQNIIESYDNLHVKPIEHTAGANQPVHYTKYDI